MEWHARAVPLPYGDAPRDFWVDRAGCLTGGPLHGSELLPGRYVLHGLVDAHAHPAVEAGPDGPVARDAAATIAQLGSWAAAGVTAIRDVGSPGGITLDLHLSTPLPRVQAAGRFLAPAGRYFPSLLPEPAAEEDLVALALAEVARGAQWVKIIADFPGFVDGVRAQDNDFTYSHRSIGELTSAVHAAGARVAVHCGLGNVSDLIELGVDSIEHGVTMDQPALQLMAKRRAAWTPTLCAVLAPLPADVDPQVSRRRDEHRERFRDLLPIAAKLGVPILAGTDGVGTLPAEVGLLSDCGLEPSAALAAATTTAYDYLGEHFDQFGKPTSLVTYDTDPRSDPATLATPRAVIIDGIRLR